MSSLREQMKKFDDAVEYYAVFHIADDQLTLMEDFPRRKLIITQTELTGMIMNNDHYPKSIVVGGEKFRFDDHHNSITTYTNEKAFVKISMQKSKYLLVVIGQNNTTREECESAMKTFKLICLR